MSESGEKIKTTHIQALPGWFVGTAEVDGDLLACAICWEPVIAWTVRTSEIKGHAPYSWAEPITIGHSSEDERYVVRSPCGIIYEPENGCHAGDGDVVRNWRDADICARNRRETKAAGK